VKRALVLAGGGVAGIAWELGVLRGLQDFDPDLAAQVIAADLVIGTSAGSAVAAQITSGTPLDDLYQAQLSAESAEIEVELDIAELLARFTAAMAGAASREEVQRNIGAMALDTRTVPEPVRLAAVAARLPVPSWPDRAMLLPAIDAQTGEMAVFTKDSGVSLVDAVAASCAVPGIWPPVSIGGRRYIDGGIRSATNADLAAGSDRVLVVVPLPNTASPETASPGAASSDGGADPFNQLPAETELLAPAQVLPVYADAASVAAFGTNPLSPATRGPAARAGRDVGRAAAAQVAAFW
jgi:NTE family protein